MPLAIGVCKKRVQILLLWYIDETHMLFVPNTGYVYSG